MQHTDQGVLSASLTRQNFDRVVHVAQFGQGKIACAARPLPLRLFKNPRGNGGSAPGIVQAVLYAKGFLELQQRRTVLVRPGHHAFRAEAGEVRHQRKDLLLESVGNAL